MSRIANVIKSKNRLEREGIKRRNKEIADIKSDMIYRIKLRRDMKVIDAIMNDNNIKDVIIQVNKRSLPKFLKMMYTEELSDYVMLQIEGNKFMISRKVVNF